jgi:hypothetical protein
MRIYFIQQLILLVQFENKVLIVLHVLLVEVWGDRNMRKPAISV